MSDDLNPKAEEIDRRKQEREELLTRLRDVTQQRDDLISQVEAMALQVDESTREIDDALLEAQRNAKKAVVGERHAEQEAAHASELSRLLEEERRRTAEIAAEFSRFRDTVARAPVEDPWGVLWRSLSQIASNCVAWLRGKIPTDSALLPWFDRAIEVAVKAARLAVLGAKIFIDFARPHAIALWKRLKNEIARLTSKS